jgi:hypothetical protein
MTGYEIMKRHQGTPEEVELEDGAKILFATLPGEYLPELLITQSALEKSSKGKDIDKDTIVMLTTCIKACLKAANPKPIDVTDEEYEVTTNNFVSRYYFKFFEKLMTMNTCGVTAEDTTKINLIKEKLAKAQNAGTTANIAAGKAGKT